MARTLVSGKACFSESSPIAQAPCKTISQRLVGGLRGGARSCFGAVAARGRRVIERSENIDIRSCVDSKIERLSRATSYFRSPAAAAAAVFGG